jgi:phage terminase Nu1 subunit (DNA packaging protein)
MLTDQEVIDKFHLNYAIILDDFLFNLKQKCAADAINILDKVGQNTNQDFLELILYNTDLPKSFLAKNKMNKK